MQKLSKSSHSYTKSLISGRTVRFQRHFLHPKHWLLWLGVILLWSVTQLLPYRALMFLGRKIGQLLMWGAVGRREVVKVNLRLCFPKMSEQERHQLLIKNFESTGMALFESAMGWWWSDQRLEPLLTFHGLDRLNKVNEEGHGTLLFSMHSLTLELGVRLYGLRAVGMGVYRPHNNPVLEYLQVRGRSRSSKGMISKYKIKDAIRAMRAGENMWYTSDQDFGPDGATFAPFFAVKEAATITGGSTMARLSKAKVMPFLCIRNEDGSGYTLELQEPLEDFPSGDDHEDATRTNKIIEQGILKAPEQYMWLHRRFKTRPNESDPDLYGRKK